MSTKDSRVDRLFDALSNVLRRQLLVALRDRTAAGELQVPLDAILDAMPVDTDAHHVQIGLVHNHLPRLSDYGYVEWDENRHTVSRGPRWTDIEPFLDERPVQLESVSEQT